MTQKIIEVLISINQNDIVKVRKWMEAKITLDSYPDKVLNWVLTEIETTPKNDNQWWPATFPAKILISDFWDLNLYSWMSANVKLKVSSIPESLVVPFSAVNSDDDWKKYVSVIENWKKVKRYVEVWEAVWNYYQILNWLKEWEKILEIDYDASKIRTDENFSPVVDENFWPALRVIK